MVQLNLELDNLKIHNIKDGSFDSAQDHAHIYFKQYFPKSKLSKKIIHVIFQHGAIEYHKRHEQFFDTLRAEYGNKLVISCMDLVGHGFSGGPRAYVDDFSIYIKDFLRFTKVLSPIYQDYEVETILIGHSLGGLILLKTLIEYQDEIPFPVKASIYSNPCIRPKIQIPKFVTKSIHNISKKIGRLRLPSIYDGFDLTHDRNRALAFNNDHLNSHFMTIQMGSEILKESKLLLSLSYFYDISSLFLISDSDIIVDPVSTDLFITGVDKHLIQTKKFSKMKHDLLNETCRIEVFKEIIKFIDNQLKK